MFFKNFKSFLSDSIVRGAWAQFVVIGEDIASINQALAYSLSIWRIKTIGFVATRILRIRTTDRQTGQ